MKFPLYFLLLAHLFDFKALCVKLAFLGDSGAQTSGTDGHYAKAVFEMIASEGVQLVIQNGDLDYQGNPAMWDSFIQQYVYNAGMEMLVTSGNHETELDGKAWFWGNDGYKEKMNSRYLQSTNLLRDKCSGEYGERFSCNIGNTFHVLIGYEQSKNVAASTVYIEEQLKQSDKTFKFCTWHRPEGKLNPGSTHTGNYGLEPMYEACRKYGAIVTTGHVHIYSRTKLISSFIGYPTTSGNDSPNPTVSCGQTIAFVLGMSGYKFDGDGPYTNREYFRTKYTAANINGNRAGALICDTTDQTKSFDCYYKLSTGTIVESFTISSEAQGLACTGDPQSPPNTGTFTKTFFSIDDVEEQENGQLYYDSSDIELVYDSDIGGIQTVNIRFTEISIPPGSTVVSAKIRFTGDESSTTSSPSLEISGHSSDNSETPMGNNGISLRPKTNAKVSWINIEPWSIGGKYETPELKSIVQELVNRAGWQTYNAISFIITGDGNTNTRTADSSTSTGTGGPELEVTYTTNGEGGEINKHFYVGAPEVGTWGGICRCPNGEIYEVGDNYDSCASLACEGGEQLGNCGDGVISPTFGGYKVICGTTANTSIPTLSPTVKPSVLDSGGPTDFISNNYFYVGEPTVGTWGGICRCPNGETYEVGDNYDSCASLACEGGEPVGSCGDGLINPNFGGYKVICGTANAPTPNPTSSIPAPTPNPTSLIPVASPTDPDNDAENKHFYVGAPQVGDWGGICKCPNGQTFQVGDNYDSCASLACEGGEQVGTCGQEIIDPQFKGYKVVCAAQNTPAPTSNPFLNPNEYIPNNHFYVGEPAVGDWGGICRCPNGQTYEVGDNFDSCASLACEGGETVGACGNGLISSSFGGYKVICGTANAPTPDPTPVPPIVDSTLTVVAQNLFWWNLFNQRGGANFFNAFRSSGPYDIMMFQECDNVQYVVDNLGYNGWEVFWGARAVTLAWNGNRFNKVAEGVQDVSEDNWSQYYGPRTIAWVRLYDTETSRHIFAVSYHGPLPVNTGGQPGLKQTAINIKYAINSNIVLGDTLILGGDFNAEIWTDTILELRTDYTVQASDWVDHVLSNTVGVLPNPEVNIIDRGQTGSDHNGLKVTFQLNALRSLFEEQSAIIVEPVAATSNIQLPSLALLLCACFIALQFVMF